MLMLLSWFLNTEWTILTCLPYSCHIAYLSICRTRSATHSLPLDSPTQKNRRFPKHDNRSSNKDFGEFATLANWTHDHVVQKKMMPLTVSLKNSPRQISFYFMLRVNKNPIFLSFHVSVIFFLSTCSKL